MWWRGEPDRPAGRRERVGISGLQRSARRAGTRRGAVRRGRMVPPGQAIGGARAKPLGGRATRIGGRGSGRIAATSQVRRGDGAAGPGASRPVDPTGRRQVGQWRHAMRCAGGAEGVAASRARQSGTPASAPAADASATMVVGAATISPNAPIERPNGARSRARRTIRIGPRRSRGRIAAGRYTSASGMTMPPASG